jgi:hypothetical protein
VSRSTEVVHFRRSDPRQLLEVLDGLAAARDGWVNVQAVLDDDETAAPDAAPGQAGVFGWLSSRGPAVPVATWVPGTTKRNGGHEPDSLGIQHGAGPRAAVTLADAGLPVPSTWRRVGDHPKRGLVMELPDGVDPKTVLEWAFPAMNVLASTPLPDTWVAIVHRR